MDRSNQFERTTRDIINAFLEVLEQKSFDKISVQDIAAAARITRSTFYQHFPDKYAVLDELCQTCMAEFSEIMEHIQALPDKTLKENDRIMGVYLTKNAKILRRLLNVKNDHVDFREEFRKVLAQYFKGSHPGLNELELTMLSGICMEHFIYCLRHEEAARHYSESLYESSVKVSLALFLLDENQEARAEFQALIGRHST